MTDQARAALAASHRQAGQALAGVPGPVRLVAHRGAGHERNDPHGPPENTLEAVEHGFAAGADAVEVDVWRTADGVVVLHHDRTTDRTTDLAGADVTRTPYDQLLKASAGAWKHARWAQTRIPTLSDAAARIPGGRALIVEVEEGPQAVPDILAATADSDLEPEQLVYISKNLDTAGKVKQQAPRHRVLWIVDTTPRWQIGGWAQGHRRGRHSARRGFDEHADVTWMVEEATRRDLDGLDTMFVYPPELPAAMADAGLTWMVWTANDPRAIEACLRDGAWAVTTDNTAEVRAWLHAAGLRTVTEAGEVF